MVKVRRLRAGCAQYERATARFNRLIGACSAKRVKKQMITRRGTLEFAKYVIVFTTRSSGATADVLRSYRIRWQIELVFKRPKSLAQLGHVPKHDDRSSRAWLDGKLLVTLLAQKLIRIGAIFPLGLPTLAAQDHVVRRVNSVSRFTRSSKLSNRTSPFGKRSIRGIRLHTLLRKSHATDFFNWQNGIPRERRSETDRLEPAACQKPVSMPSRGSRPRP
jgi:hypothetical protein